MSGILSRFEKWSNRRLRKSQIKILYQNIGAIEYLKNFFQTLEKAGHAVNSETLSAIIDFESAVHERIVQMAYVTVLPDEQSKELLAINNALKFIYSSILEGTKQARGALGQMSGDLVPFATRFSPANGWDKFSDADWDHILSKSLNRLTE